MLFLGASQQFQTVDVRHPQVRQEQVDRRHLNAHQRFLAGCSLVDCALNVLRQETRGQMTLDPRIIDDKDALEGRRFVDVGICCRTSDAFQSVCFGNVSHLGLAGRECGAAIVAGESAGSLVIKKCVRGMLIAAAIQIPTLFSSCPM